MRRQVGGDGAIDQVVAVAHFDRAGLRCRHGTHGAGQDRPETRVEIAAGRHDRGEGLGDGRTLALAPVALGQGAAEHQLVHHLSREALKILDLGRCPALPGGVRGR